MTRYKLLVVDVDGTIVDGKGNISAEDKRALARAALSGVKVSLSTGRVITACRELIARLSLDGYHIFFDGALVSDSGQKEEIYIRPLKRDVVRRMVEFARASDTYLELYSKECFFAERNNWSDDIHRRFFRVEPTIVDFGDIWNRELIIKAELVVHSLEEAAKAELFQNEFTDCLRFSIARSPAFPEVDFINIIDMGVSKGEALTTLASFLGIAIEEVIAVGDGLNDIPLLKAAGLAVAMGNAFPEVKEAADYVTLDIDHSGLAVAIDRFILKA
jgi:Cof subfamily protein (haloacid dehalogenase superfamily)